jgi:hypothetical protein
MAARFSECVRAVRCCRIVTEWMVRAPDAKYERAAQSLSGKEILSERPCDMRFVHERHEMSVPVS